MEARDFVSWMARACAESTAGQGTRMHAPRPFSFQLALLLELNSMEAGVLKNVQNGAATGR